MSYRELLLGAGSRRTKDLTLPYAAFIYGKLAVQGVKPPEGLMGTIPVDQFVNVSTLDINAAHRPNIVFNLERIDGQECNRIPNHNVQYRDGRDIRLSTGHCPDNTYNEIHAYEILEHIGRQGDYRKFFWQFEEFWRVLKPDGLLFATCPHYASLWAWGDPSHSRVINSGTLVFLRQASYQEQVGITAMSDFRWCYSANFDVLYSDESDGETHRFVLRALK